jgi:replicative DNA helicase
MSDSNDAELAVVADLIIAPIALPRVITDGLQLAHFDNPTARHVFASMLALHDKGEAIDVVTLAAHADMDAADVDRLTASFGSVGNVLEHAKAVKRFALRRTWTVAAQLLHQAAAEDDEQLVAQAEQTLARPTVTEDSYTPGKLADEVAEYIQDDAAPGISTGFGEFDTIIGGGLRPGDTTVLMAWESMGKSALAFQWLTLAADTLGRDKVHAYINDMSPRDCALRMVAHSGAVSWGKLARKRLDNQDMAKVLDMLNRMPFGVTDASQWTAEQVSRHMRINRWDICVLDVLHNMPYSDEGELHRNAATLVNAARSSGCHLILVCHLNQERAKSEILPRPVIRDIRGSGMLSKLAATVVSLHRPQSMNGPFVETSMVGTITAEKARHGERGMGIDICFVPQHMRFRLPTTTDRAAA